MGYRKAANPIISLIHKPRRRERLPRPFTREEQVLAWKYLMERGNERLRFAAAVAEESGLRIGEIARLRLQDIDLTGRRFFVRLPNKGMVERYALFSEKTIRFYKEWMAVRDPRCTHDQILHSKRLHICNPHELIREFGAVMCKVYDREKRHDEGFEKWSGHRWRHTMASNLVKNGADAAVVMTAGGWKTFEAMAGYAAPDEERGRRGYEDAMEKSREQLRAKSRKRSLSLSDLLDRKRHIEQSGLSQ